MTDTEVQTIKISIFFSLLQINFFYDTRSSNWKITAEEIITC